MQELGEDTSRKTIRGHISKSLSHAEKVMATGTIQKNMVLLWDNPSPSSSFSGQSIQFSYSGYAFLLVLFDSNGIGDLATTFQVAQSGKSVTAWTYLNSVNRKREGSITATGITFQNGIESGQTKNSIMVPLKVYGLRA